MPDTYLPSMNLEDSKGGLNILDLQPTLSPILPPPPATPSKIGFTPLVTVIDFNHARGPEVESWFGVEEGFDPAAEFGWSLLPFMALTDGAHA